MYKQSDHDSEVAKFYVLWSKATKSQIALKAIVVKP